MSTIEPAITETIARLNEAKITFSIDLDLWAREIKTTPEVEATWRDAAARLGLDEISFDRYDSPKAKEAWDQYSRRLIELGLEHDPYEARWQSSAELGDLVKGIAQEVLDHAG